MKKEVSNRLVLICFVAAITTFLSCEKEAGLPTVVTEVVDNIEAFRATFCGSVTNDGGAKVDLKGFCIGTDHNPIITSSSVYYCKGGPKSFTTYIPLLVPDTYYHVRAFAMNSEGTAYGNEVHFRTKPVFTATLVPIGPYGVTIFSAEAGGHISDDGGAPVLEKGVCLSTTAYPTINDRIFSPYGDDVAGSFMCYISDLKPETLYHLRAYAISMGGVAYGDDREFKTLPLPDVTTDVVGVYTQTTAKVNGILTWAGPEILVRHAGFCYGTSPTPTYDGGFHVLATIGDVGEFTETLMELTPGTLYYVRAFVTVLKDYLYYHYDDRYVVYGNEVTFRTRQ